MLCDKTAHFRVGFVFIMVKLFNQLLDMPYLLGGWIFLAKEKCSLTGMETNVCTKFERNMLFVNKEHFWNLLFQLMKHGTNTLHVAFIFVFSLHKYLEPPPCLKI